MCKRAYLFDMDGALVDNCRYHVLSWLEFAKRHGGKLTETQVIEWMGAPGRDYIVRMFDEPVPADRMTDLLAEKEAIYRELYRPKLGARKGLMDFLEGARKADIPCAVVTGGPTENVDFVLAPAREPSAEGPQYTRTAQPSESKLGSPPRGGEREESAFPRQQPIFTGGKLPLKPSLLLEAAKL